MEWGLISNGHKRAEHRAHSHASCSHAHGASGSISKLRYAVVLTLSFVALEAVVGFWSKSLALVSDAGHNFTDAVALAISWYALHVSKKPSNARKTFGYHRVGILATLINALTLVGLGVFILWEAYERFRSPVAVQPWPMVTTAAIALLLNVVISLWLHADAKHDLNIRSAYLHMVGDAASSIGVLAAGLLVARTGSKLADPIVSTLIACLILWSSWSILVESVDILLESVPRGLDMPDLEQALRECPEVVGVHDLHVWTIASEMVACSCHLVVGEQSVRSGQRIQQSVSEMLRERFGITHSTLQIETDSCEVDSVYCTLNKSSGRTAAGLG